MAITTQLESYWSKKLQKLQKLCFIKKKNLYFFKTSPVFLVHCNLTEVRKLETLSSTKSVCNVCMCFNAMDGSGPAYLSGLLHVYTPPRTLRSSSDTRMLEIQRYKRKTPGFRTFSCFGPHIWNSLPQDLRHCSTLSSFKAKLKTFLFSQYFHPN